MFARRVLGIMAEATQAYASGLGILRGWAARGDQGASLPECFEFAVTRLLGILVTRAELIELCLDAKPAFLLITATNGWV